MARAGLAAALVVVIFAGCGGETPKGARAQQGNIAILNLRGTPYQMGLQHGEPPVPQLAYIGFSLDALVGRPGATAPAPASVP